MVLVYSMVEETVLTQTPSAQIINMIFLTEMPFQEITTPAIQPITTTTQEQQDAHIIAANAFVIPALTV